MIVMTNAAGNFFRNAAGNFIRNAAGNFGAADLIPAGTDDYEPFHVSIGMRLKTYFSESPFHASGSTIEELSTYEGQVLLPNEGMIKWMDYCFPKTSRSAFNFTSAIKSFGVIDPTGFSEVHIDDEASSHSGWSDSSSDYATEAGGEPPTIDLSSYSLAKDPDPVTLSFETNHFYEDGGAANQNYWSGGTKLFSAAKNIKGGFLRWRIGSTETLMALGVLDEEIDMDEEGSGVASGIWRMEYKVFWDIKIAVPVL